MDKIIGLILPPIIDIINSQVGDRRLRFLISFFFCAALGAGSHALRNGGFLGVEPVADDILWVFALSQVSYNLAYKDTTLQDMIRTEGDTK